MEDGAASDESYRSINHAERMMRKMENYHRCVCVRAWGGCACVCAEGVCVRRATSPSTTPRE